jgi:hypothetical protein
MVPAKSGDCQNGSGHPARGVPFLFNKVVIFNKQTTPHDEFDASGALLPPRF